MAGSNLTLLSSYYTDHSGLSSCLALDEVICFCALCTETLLQSLEFSASRKFLYIIKNKVSVFSSFGSYFICLLFLPLPQYHSPFCTLASNTAVFYSFLSLANVLENKQHFTFYINSVCVFLTFMMVLSVPLISAVSNATSHAVLLTVHTAVCQ
jgi:hypothetical protein